MKATQRRRSKTEAALEDVERGAERSRDALAKEKATLQAETSRRQAAQRQRQLRQQQLDEQRQQVSAIAL